MDSKINDTGNGVPFRRKFLRAGLAVAAALVLFKLAGLIQAVAIGHFFPDKSGDIYVFAFENCIFGLFLLGEGIILPAFLPVFMKARASGPDGEERAWRFASAFLTVHAIVLAAAVSLLMLFPESVVRLFTTWTPENSPGKFEIAAQTVRRLSPALLGLSLGTTTYALLNAHKRFFIAAFGDAVWKFTAVVILVVFASASYSAPSVLITGIVIGSALKLLTHIIGLRDNITHFRPSLSIRTPEFREFALLTLPLVAGTIFALTRDVVNNVYFPSLLSDGLMKANSWGSKLEKVLVLLIPATLAIAVFPFFCEMAEKDDRSEFGTFVTRASRQMTAIFLPLAAVTAVLSAPLVSLVFGGGQFDAESVRRTSVAMGCYTFALPAVAVETILMKAFFASRRTVAVTVLGIVFSSVSMLISWYGATYFRADEILVLAIIAGGFALSRWLKTSVLAILFRKSAPAFPPAETASFLFRLLAASLAAAAAAYGALIPAQNCLASLGLSGKLASAAALLAGGTAAILAIIPAFAILKIREPLELFLLLRTRKRRNS